MFVSEFGSFAVSCFHVLIEEISVFMMPAHFPPGSRYSFGSSSSCPSVFLAVILLSLSLLVDLMMVMLVFGSDFSEDGIPLG